MDARARAQLVHRGDLDELVRAIDSCANRGDHGAVDALRRACDRAVEETGRQLWGAAAYAGYRLALDAPAELAVEALLGGHDRHTLGPLTEVIAQHHQFDEVADLLGPGPTRGVVAAERVARGDDLRGDERTDLEHLAIDGVWHAWEGVPPLATYRPGEVLSPAPPLVGQGPWRALDARPARDRADTRFDEALTGVAGAWEDRSNAEAVAIGSEGDARSAIAAIVPGPARWRDVTMASAVARVTWAASLAGRRGRRRGQAAGRSAAWWLLRVFVVDQAGSFDALDDPDELEFHLANCRWLEFDTGVDHEWRCQVAAAHPGGMAFALDVVDDPDPPVDNGVGMAGD